MCTRITRVYTCDVHVYIIHTCVYNVYITYNTQSYVLYVIYTLLCDIHVYIIHMWSCVLLYVIYTLSLHIICGIHMIFVCLHYAQRLHDMYLYVCIYMWCAHSHWHVIYISSLYVCTMHKDRMICTDMYWYVCIYVWCVHVHWHVMYKSSLYICTIHEDHMVCIDMYLYVMICMYLYVMCTRTLTCDVHIVIVYLHSTRRSHVHRDEYHICVIFIVYLHSVIFIPVYMWSLCACGGV